MAISLSVGIIAPPWLPIPPPAYGGTEAFLDTLARGLTSAGHEVLLFTTGDATSPVRRMSCFKTAVGIGEGGLVHEAHQVVAAYDALAGMDVIHDNTLVGPLYALSQHGGPVVTTTHGPYDEDLAPVYKAVSHKVNVVAISHYQASTAAGWKPAAVIHHGLDLDRFPVGDGKGAYALFLGRMHPEKGVHVAAEVARATGFPLRIAAKMSEPVERDYFEEAVRPLLGGDIEYIGEVGLSEKLELLGAATCLLNPIRWDEPFGLVMVEALACGTPVVATARGSVPEIVDHGKTGYCCRGERSLGLALGQVGDLDRARCREAAERRFSAARMVEDYVAVYRRALGPGQMSMLDPHQAA